MKIDQDLLNENRRILVIDDNESIHNDFRDILARSGEENEQLEALSESLFGGEGVSAELPGLRKSFQLEFAGQGEEGLRKYREACQTGRPHAVAFVDMRMPPGWDGLKTIEELWKVDDDLQVVICTAFSDHSWAEISQRLRNNQNLLILKKPFEAVEIIQMATALCDKWVQTQKARMTIEEMEFKVEHQVRDVKLALNAAMFAMKKLRSEWKSGDVEEARRVIKVLESKSFSHMKERSTPRKLFHTEVSVLLTDPMVTTEPLFRAITRDVSTGGMSFLYYKEIPEPRVIVFLETAKKTPIACYGTVLRCERVSYNLWEYGVKFDDRPTEAKRGQPAEMTVGAGS